MKIKSIILPLFAVLFAVSPSAFAEERIQSAFAATDSESSTITPGTSLVLGLLFTGAGFWMYDEGKSNEEEEESCERERASNPFNFRICQNLNILEEPSVLKGVGILSGIVGVIITGVAISEFSKDSNFAGYLDGVSLRENSGGVFLQKKWNF